jgi:hypothetical protein
MKIEKCIDFTLLHFCHLIQQYTKHYVTYFLISDSLSLRAVCQCNKKMTTIKALWQQAIFFTLTTCSV